MSSLPYEESDSENEYVVGQTPLQSPPQSPSEPTAAPTTAPTVKPFQPPVIQRRNEATSIPSDVRFVFATDLSSASYLDYISTISNAVEVINIQTLIQKDEPKKDGDKKKPVVKPTTTTPQKFINYTLRLIPNTNTIIGFGDVEISPKYANFIAKALFPRGGNQFITNVSSILVLNAISIASLSANNQLYYQQQEQYPYFYQLNNFSRIAGVGKPTTAPSNPESTPTTSTSTTTTTTSGSSTTPMTQFQPDPKTGEQIQVLPQTIGLGGLAAAIITWATLYHIPCCAGLSIKNRSFPTELYVSFDKMCKLMNFQNGQNGQLPSMYGVDTSAGAKVTVGMRNQAVKAILGLLEKKEAYNDRILPHAKQSSSMSTSSMFF